MADERFKGISNSKRYAETVINAGESLAKQSWCYGYLSQVNGYRRIGDFINVKKFADEGKVKCKRDDFAEKRRWLIDRFYVESYNAKATLEERANK
jgi:hypothetical protein